MDIVGADWDTLASKSGDASWVSTFTYWLGVLRDADSALGQDALVAGSAMSFQYDVEEQGGCDVLRVHPDFVPDPFKPVAPVTMTQRWSPFPLAAELMGAPSRFQHNDGTASAVFVAAVVPKVPRDLGRDQAHFARLLQVAASRARDAGAYVLLVGCPGWSYAHDPLPQLPEVQGLMRRFGFVALTRRPH